jgi:hypothetical protein
MADTRRTIRINEVGTVFVPVSDRSEHQPG